MENAPQHYVQIYQTGKRERYGKRVKVQDEVPPILAIGLEIVPLKLRISLVGLLKVKH